MKKGLKRAAIAASIALFSMSSTHAALIGVAGGTSNVAGSTGSAATIISAPANVNDDMAFNTAIQGFDEKQVFTLVNDLNVDSGVITAGTVVSSHMLFLNSGPGNDKTLIEHGAGTGQSPVTFTFDGTVLGVMSSSNGSLEIASQFLGAMGTIYPSSTYGARGMEGNPLDGLVNDDWYSFASNTISLGMRVTEPGDWIRVITTSPTSTVQASAASTFALFGLALAGLGFTRKRAKS